MTQKSSATQLRRSQRIAVAVAPKIIRLLAKTWRVHVYNEEGWRALRQQKKPFVFSLWHGHMLPLLYQHRGQGIHVLISEHRDGEMIAQVAQQLGLRTIRGSTSRGAARALLEMARALEGGNEIAVTPDGPRGPAYTFAPGALIVSQRAQAPIVPIGVYVDRAWRLKSWDAFMIPKPFANVYIAYGDPTPVNAPDARSAAEQTETFAVAMNETMARAQMLAKEPSIAKPV
jgi:lysophospholipid acyltransferase (LPLAT)-like uncharacterized protein